MIRPARPHSFQRMTHSAKTPDNASLSNTSTQEANKTRVGAKPPRLNAKTRKAIDILVTTGRTQRQAAEIVGLNEKSLSRSLKKPHIAAHYEQQKMLALQDVKQARKMGEIAAMHVAIDLMHNSKSDSVRARMVEFFAGEASKGVTVNVQNNVNSTGYEMARPGQRVVDIVDSKADKGADTPKDAEIIPDHTANR